jgi:hypothetical protein
MSGLKLFRSVASVEECRTLQLSVQQGVLRSGSEVLVPLIGDTVETAAILGQWTELMRLKASIETGAVVPSVILRKLAAAGAGNALSRALRALGRIERTLFTLQWLSDPALRQRSHAGLNKGEASNARSNLREPELPCIGPEPHHSRHRSLEPSISTGSSGGCALRERRFPTISWLMSLRWDGSTSP